MALLTNVLFSVLIVIIMVPVLSRIATQIGLTDKPGGRKLHKQPTPLVGGVAIGVSLLMCLLLQPAGFSTFTQFYMIVSCGYVLLILGLLDDYREIKASYKLLVQVICAVMIVRSGLHLQSLFGLFGIENIPLQVMQLLSGVIIVGVVNAYNLIDGVDGLSGMVSLLAMVVLAWIAYHSGAEQLVWFFGIMAGSLSGFLRFNLAQKNKIFLGDAGSLFLGFIIVCSSIALLNHSSSKNDGSGNAVLVSLIGLMAVPVFDSVRVYIERYREGRSPFIAERNHIHHLLQGFEMSPIKISLSIVLFSMLLIATAFVFQKWIEVTWVVIAIFLIFRVLIFVLNSNKHMLIWQQKLKSFEEL